MRDESPLEIPEIFENIETMVFGYLKSVGMSMSMSNVFENPQTSTQPIVQHFLPHLIFWLYKDVYYETAERYTTGALSSNSITDNLEANRRTAERNIKKAVFRKRSDAEANKTTKEYYDLVGHKEQRSNEISPVYHLTKLDYKAVQEYSPSTRNLKLVDLLANKRIGSSKAVSGQDIKDAYQDYYIYVRQGAKQEDATRWIEALLDLSSIESQLAPGFLYAVSKYADTNDLKRLSNALQLLLGINLIPVGSNQLPVESRFLYDRISYIEPILQQKFEDYRDLFYRLFLLQTCVLGKRKDIVGSKLTVLECMPKLYESLKSVSPVDAAKYFKQKYNLFDVYTFPELENSTTWTSKLLKIYRKVVTGLTANSMP